MENPPCVLPDVKPVEPVSLEVAEDACAGIRNQKTRANCVFDVRVTGEPGFATTYLLAERIAANSTTITMHDDPEPTRYGQPVTFTAIVIRGANAEGAPKGSVEFTVPVKAIVLGRVDGPRMEAKCLPKEGRSSRLGAAELICSRLLRAGWPWAVARPGLPQIRTCAINASGSS